MRKPLTLLMINESNIMSIKTKKKQIIKRLEEVTDPSLLQAIDSLLDYAFKRGMKPLSEEDIEDMLEESEREIEKGKVYKHADLKKEIRTWRKK